MATFQTQAERMRKHWNDPEPSPYAALERAEREELGERLHDLEVKLDGLLALVDRLNSNLAIWIDLARHTPGVRAARPPHPPAATTHPRRRPVE